MKKVLYIGWCMPYDSVAHAGGQIFNYYIKEMSKAAEVKLITIALPGEKEKATIEKYGVEARYIEFDHVGIAKKIASLSSKFNPWHKYGHIVTKFKADAFINEVMELRKSGYIPDVIVLQWTQTILFVDRVKKIYPAAKYIAAEEDVTYLRLEREYLAEKGVTRYYKKIVFQNEKKRELHALSEFNIVYTNNQKDKKLLLSGGFDAEKLKVLVPYFHHYNVERRDTDNNDILFFGNMGRPENYNAAKEFIECVLPKIKIANTRFIALGGKPEKIKPYESRNVVVTGYVENPDDYFANSAVFVAPIRQGAGIKIKVLEAMSSGIPVITTKVGIEGIPAVNGKDFFLYDNNEELVLCIEKLLKDEELRKQIGECGKGLVLEQFDYVKSVEDYKINLLGN